jgi:NADP-dependent 3-hydroxy acid dehydrogenase YdfG
VTGASSGIGRGITTRLIAAGHDVVANSRGSASLAALTDELSSGPGRLVTVAGDVNEEATIDRVLKTCQEELRGPPTIAVISAGGGLPGTVLSSDPARWKQLVDVNILAVLRQLRALGATMVAAAAREPVLHRPYDIVVLGSSVGRYVSPYNSVYGATKFAVHGAVEGLRREIGPLGVRVSLVEPGVVQTNFQAAAGYDLEWFETYAAEIGPVLEADDVAAVVEFMVSQPPQVHINDVMVRPTRQSYP